MKKENKKNRFAGRQNGTRAADVPWLITKSNRPMKRVPVI